MIMPGRGVGMGKGTTVKISLPPLVHHEWKSAIIMVVSVVVETDFILKLETSGCNTKYSYPG
jgi:hypothetical protein